MTSDFDEIPVIDISPLFAASASGRPAVDTAIGTACREVGFFLVVGQPPAARLDPSTWQALLAFFDLPVEEKARLALKKYNPANKNIYRGYYPPTNSDAAYKEGIDMGSDRATGGLGRADPFMEPNVWPAEALLPAWRDAVDSYFRAMETVGLALVRAMARYLELPDGWFDRHFTGTNSTLRLLHYPVRTAESMQSFGDTIYRVHDGRRRPLVGREHCDSGCVTLLAQDEIGGLQALNSRGAWIDVPALPESLVVNLGKTLQRWTNDAFVATTHRVLGSERERYSIPFFFEPNLDAVIECVPSQCVGTPRYGPIPYHDCLLDNMKGFVEFKGAFG